MNKLLLLTIIISIVTLNKILPQQPIQKRIQRTLSKTNKLITNNAPQQSPYHRTSAQLQQHIARQAWEDRMAAAANVNLWYMSIQQNNY